jgi:hypothetical protein
MLYPEFVARYKFCRLLVLPQVVADRLQDQLQLFHLCRKEGAAACLVFLHYVEAIEEINSLLVAASAARHSCADVVVSSLTIRFAFCNVQQQGADKVFSLVDPFLHLLADPLYRKNHSLGITITYFRL